MLFLGSPRRGTPFTRFRLLAASLLTLLDIDVNIMRPLIDDNVNLNGLDDKFRERVEDTPRL